LPTLIFYIRDFMPSVSTITNCKKYVIILLINVLIGFQSLGQENSPYSRYAYGDIIPTQNILNRSMGGMSLAYWDLQSINFTNPASYAQLKLTTFDIGLEYDSRTLRSSSSETGKYKSGYLIPAYFNLGFNLSKKKNWGMNIGLKPITRINYEINTRTRLQGIDSVLYRYSGSGGSFQAFLGMAYGSKKLSFGFNAGYMFGGKHNSTKLVFLNDTVHYRQANYSDSTSFGGIFANFGGQYTMVLSGDMNLRIGGTLALQNHLNAQRDITRETFEFAERGIVQIDSVFRASNIKGSLVTPASYGIGVILEKLDKWMFGVDFNYTAWSNYKFYGQPDAVRNNWTLRVGGQFIPQLNSKSYWSRVAYRAGIYYGPDYINLGAKLNSWAITFGTGLPIRRNVYTNQYTTINTSFEIGGVGNKVSPVRENIFRFCLGFNLSDIWFIKKEYQ
jgi:long-subunit fatty acid transport protein